MSVVALGMALIDSVKSGDRAVVESLLDAGADPNTVDLFEGLRAPQVAVRGGHADVARLLQEKGARTITPSPGVEGDADDSSPPTKEEGPTREEILAQIAGL